MDEKQGSKKLGPSKGIVVYFTAYIFYREEGPPRKYRETTFRHRQQDQPFPPASLFFILPFLLSNTYFDHPIVHDASTIGR